MILPAGNVYNVPGTSGGAAASADVELNFTGWASATSPVTFGACVLGSSDGNGSGLGISITVDPTTKTATVTAGDCTDAAAQVYVVNSPVSTPHGHANVTRMMNNTNFPHGDIYDHEFPAGTGPEACQALCDSDAKCFAWTFLERGPAHGMSCCIKGPIPDRDGCPIPAPRMWSGAKTAGTVECGGNGPSPPPAPSSGVPLFDETVLTVRVMPDRSLADFFVQGGRWAGTTAWMAKEPRNAADSQVSVWANNASGISVDVGVWGMGCGWLTPSYTDSPTL